MGEVTTILVPIRYPLGDASARTLAAAGRFAHDHTPADLSVLHVNLYQRSASIQTRDLTRAISATLNGVEASVTTRRGMLLEEIILDEATQIGADIVVVGTDQHPIWRRLLGRLLGSRPAVGAYLQEHTAEGTDVMVVDTAADTPTVESV